MKLSTVAVALSLLFLVGCRSAEPVCQSSGVHIPEELQALDRRALALKVLESPHVVRRGWYVEEPMSDRIRIGIRVRSSHLAIMDVMFDHNNRFTPVLVRTENLDQKGGKIHPFYNNWVNFLEIEMRRALSELRAEVSGKERPSL